MPFASFVAWVQLELYRRNFESAEELINQYISRSTNLADPSPKKRLKANGNEDDSNIASSNDSLVDDKPEEALNPA